MRITRQKLCSCRMESRAGGEGEHQEPVAKSNGTVLRKTAHKESL